MDVAEILETAEKNLSQSHEIDGITFDLRIPNRKEVLLLIQGMNPAEPKLEDMFIAAERCLEYINGWSGPVDAEGNPIEYSAEVMTKVLGEKIELGQKIVQILMSGFSLKKEAEAAEKKQ